MFVIHGRTEGRKEGRKEGRFPRRILHEHPDAEESTTIYSVESPSGRSEDVATRISWHTCRCCRMPPSRDSGISTCRDRTISSGDPARSEYRLEQELFSAPDETR
jgi:hypothetical protein